MNAILKFPLSITNYGPSTDPSAVVTFVIPPGTQINKIQSQIGIVTGTTWTIAPFALGNTYSGYLFLEITNAALIGSNTVQVFVNGSLVDAIPANNTAVSGLLPTMNCPGGTTVYIQNEPCPPPSATPVADAASMFSGYVSRNDTKCTVGVTKYKKVVASEVNFTMSYFDEVTGYYEGNPIDTGLVWSFQYSIYCVDACSACPQGNEWGPFGPVTVTGPAVTADAGLWACTLLNTCSIDSLDDVAITNPLEGDILYNDGTDFINVSGEQALGSLAGRVIAADDAVVSTDGIILINNVANTVELTIDPAILGGTFKKPLHVKVIGAAPGTFAATIEVSSGVIVDNTTIGGAGTTYAFTSLGEAVVFWSDGTNVYVF